MISERRSRLRESLARPVVGAVVLLVIYVALSFVNATGGYLGTDTGAKVATLDHMVEDGTNRPAIGYWAETWDPDGDYHPLFDSVQNEDGEWVNVTTLPMLITARPLYDLGGYRAALLLPILGGVAAALAARNIGRQLGGDEAASRAFWIVGLGSPVAIYALDFWEHSIGAALMLWAAALLLSLLRDRAGLWAPLLAGALLGASATMRAETFVVTLALVGGTCLTVLFRRQLLRSVATGAVAVLGFAGPWFANAALETSLGGNSRTTRVTGEAQREFWNETGIRFEEALVTWFGLPGTSYPGDVLLGGIVVLSVVGAFIYHRRGEHRISAYMLGVAGVIFLLAAVSSGLAFVPGAIVASPVAIAAVWVHKDGLAGRFLLPVALVATVLTWMFQLTGGAGPQWGGRYLLAPTLLLTTLGVVALREAPPVIARTLVVFAVSVTAFGMAWLTFRSHEVEEFFDNLVERPEDVVISTNGFLVREAGDAYADRLYLSLGRGAELEGAVDVVDEAGFSTFGVLAFTDDLPDIDATAVEVERVELLDVSLWYHVFELP